MELSEPWYADPRKPCHRREEWADPGLINARFPVRAAQTLARLCLQCPVFSECRKEYLREQDREQKLWGVWGGIIGYLRYGPSPNGWDIVAHSAEASRNEAESALLETILCDGMENDHMKYLHVLSCLHIAAVERGREGDTTYCRSCKGPKTIGFEISSHDTWLRCSDCRYSRHYSIERDCHDAAARHSRKRLHNVRILATTVYNGQPSTRVVYTYRADAPMLPTFDMEIDDDNLPCPF